MMNSIRFLHISDTHIGSSDDFKLQGIKTLSPAQKLIDYIETLPFKPEFIIHTGDIVHELPDTDAHIAYKIANSMFSQINIPIYYVTGNHDTSVNVSKYMTMGKKEDLSKSLNTYRFDMNGFRFLTIDARGSDKIDPHGFVSNEQIDIVKKEITTGSLPLIVFIHFPMIELDCPWIDRDMLIINAKKLRSLFRIASSRIRGVFFGHIHQGLQAVRDGIFYSSVPSSCIQFTTLPNEMVHRYQSTGNAYFNIVTITKHDIFSKEIVVPNGTISFIEHT